MNIYVYDSEKEINYNAALLIAERIRSNPGTVLGLATGSTPMGVYQELIELYRKGKVDFYQTVSFNLDEYYPIERTHPQSYYSYMRENLFKHINIPDGHTHIPNGSAADVETHCKEYERSIIEAGGINLQLLGIGRNGHIGFNEPGTAFEKETHVVELAEETINDNARFFQKGELMPTQAITMGIKTIMRSKEILLLAKGKNKAGAVKDALFGPITSDVPASVLQLHPKVTVLLDHDAASLLEDHEVVRGQGNISFIDV